MHILIQFGAADHDDTATATTITTNITATTTTIRGGRITSSSCRPYSCNIGGHGNDSSSGSDNGVVCYPIP